MRGVPILVGMLRILSNRLNNFLANAKCIQTQIVPSSLECVFQISSSLTRASLW